RITPSVAEQEGQQTETEATGAPQKHHYTLNQQVGSITHDRCDNVFSCLRSVRTAGPAKIFSQDSASTFDDLHLNTGV
ncbi:hypothetical protein M2Y83_15850, partial [Klebsiella pneumoniae]|nr:hypothetical protein [Klebsiella pneumoniae]